MEKGLDDAEVRIANRVVPELTSSLQSSLFRLMELQVSDSTDLSLAFVAHDISQAPAFKTLSCTCGPPYFPCSWEDGKLQLGDIVEHPVWTARSICCNGVLLAI